MRPFASGKTVCRLLWPWPPLIDHRMRSVSLSWFLLRKQTLHALIQYACRGKQEGANWRQRSRNPSVPVGSASVPRILLGSWEPLVRVVGRWEVRSPNDTEQETTPNASSQKRWLRLIPPPLV